MVLEVSPRHRIFLPMTRITAIESGHAIATGLVNMRRFAPRPAETLVMAQLLDRKVTVRTTGEPVTVVDVGIDQNRQRDWVIAKYFVRKAGSGLRRRGETLTLDWDEISDPSVEQPDQPADSLLSAIDDLRPADIASLIHDLPFKRQLEVAQSMDDDLLADVLEELPDADQVAVLAMLDDDRAADILEEMDPGDAADLLSELTPERAEELLGLVEPDDAEDLRRLLTYDEKSAGGMMTTEPIVIAADATVAEALARISGCCGNFRARSSRRSSTTRSRLSRQTRAWTRSCSSSRATTSWDCPSSTVPTTCWAASLLTTSSTTCCRKTGANK